MFKKKCPHCTKKIERKFHFCPWCGYSFKKQRSEEDFGMLGQNDEVEQQVANEIKLPFGMNGIFNGLIKQIEKELAGMENSQAPKGFKIQISAGKPKIQNLSKHPVRNTIRTIAVEEVNEAEKARRMELERVEAKSHIRRLPEGIIYEIDAPGVKSVKDVVITQLEESMEVKVYTAKRCYVKSIPLKLNIVDFSVKPNKVLLRLQN